MLTEILTPQSHQRIINRLSSQISDTTPELNKELLKKIEWHTNEYLKKTGNLPN